MQHYQFNGLGFDSDATYRSLTLVQSHQWPALPQFAAYFYTTDIVTQCGGVWARVRLGMRNTRYPQRRLATINYARATR